MRDLLDRALANDCRERQAVQTDGGQDLVAIEEGDGLVLPPSTDVRYLAEDGVPVTVVDSEAWLACDKAIDIQEVR